MDIKYLKSSLIIKETLLAMYKNDAVCLESHADRKQAQSLVNSISVRIAQIEEEIRKFEN